MEIKMCVYCFLLFPFFVLAQPKIKFHAKVIDYGISKQNSNPVREIGFTNIGDETLIIKNVKTSCGCLVASWPKEPILPGESGIIKTRYDMRRLNKINKTISIYSNSHNEPKIVLKVKGFITKLPPQPKIEFKSTIFDFDTVSQGTILRDINFEFKNIGTDTLIIFDVKSSVGSLAPSYSKQPIPPNNKGNISAVFDTRSRFKMQHKRLNVHSNDSTNLVIPISVKGFVKKKKQQNE